MDGAGVETALGLGLTGEVGEAEGEAVSIGDGVTSATGSST
jgi:hypothetical protein